MNALILNPFYKNVDGMEASSNHLKFHHFLCIFPSAMPPEGLFKKR